MIRLANVLIIDADEARASQLKARLGKGGYHAAIAADAAQALGAAKSEHPDLIFLGRLSGADSVALGEGLKADPATTDIPVLLLVENEDAAISQAALKAGFDDVLAHGCDDVELFARMRPLVRLATMHAELRMRAAVATQFGLDVRDRVGAQGELPPHILVVGDQTEKVVAILEGKLTVTSNLYEAEDLLSRNNFDAAVLSFADEPEGLLGFCSQVRNNPRLFNLPMVLLTANQGELDEAYRRGATRVLAQGVDPSLLRIAVASLVRRQQLRWAIRALLNQSLAPATQDPVTGLYNPAFLDVYVERRLAAAKAHHRHLAVIYFDIPGIENVRAQFGDDAGEHLTQQLGHWIAGLLRAEDLVARTGATRFCVALPDTPLGEADVVMHRIAGVLDYTDFAVREVYQPVKVWVQVGSTDAQPDDDAHSLLERARGRLN